MRTSFEEPIETDTVMPQEDTKKCPFCAERILAEAIKCRYCGEFLNGRRSPPLSTPSKPGGKWYQSTATIVIALLTLGPLALPLVWKNPHYSQMVKTIITVIVIVLTVVLTVLMYYAVSKIIQQFMNQFQSLGI